MIMNKLYAICAGFVLLTFVSCANQELLSDTNTVFVSQEKDLHLQTLSRSSTAGIVPTLISGNPTCAALGYKYGFKPSVSGKENVSGTFTDSNNVTVSWAYAPNSKTLISWNSSTPIDAMIVKGGDAAHVYRYSPALQSDANLATPRNGGGRPAAVSHVQFCYNSPTGTNG